MGICCLPAPCALFSPHYANLHPPPRSPIPGERGALVALQGSMAEDRPVERFKVSAPTASPDWSGTSARCPPRRCPALSILCRTPAVRQYGEDCWVDRGRST